MWPRWDSADLASEKFNVSDCAYVCVCVCVCERVSECVCVCVRVSEWVGR